MTSSSLGLSSYLLVGELLKRASHKTPDIEAYVFDDERVTYKQMDDNATGLAGWFQSQGIQKGDKIGFMLKNSISFVEIVFGITLSGAVGVPINFRLGSEEVVYIVNNSDTEILFIDDEYAEMVLSIKNRLDKVKKIIVIGSNETLPGLINYQSIIKNKTIYTPCEDLTDDDVSFIVYTSGTTGRPKGAVLTHKNICQNLLNLVYQSNTNLYSRELICVPLFHIAGLCKSIMTCLYNGTTIIHREYNPIAILKTIEREKINSLFLVPAMWNFLFQVPNLKEFDLSSVTTCSTGAAITPLELKKRILGRFENADLVDTFGQTETTASTTYIRGEDTIRKPTSVGRSIINVEVRIVDEDMNDVKTGVIGEIVYRGPTVMKEYYKNPEATKKAFKGGWFHSGDLVKMDEEGFIYVVDRINNMIISGGENIYPAEIEEVLYQMPEILECAVIGVPNTDWGESVKAIIVLKPGKVLSSDEVIEYCKGFVASYKKPKEVEFIDELPRNASGKVLKYILQKSREVIK